MNPTGQQSNNLERVSSDGWITETPRRWKHEWMNKESPHLAGSQDTIISDFSLSQYIAATNLHGHGGYPLNEEQGHSRSVADADWHVKTHRNGWNFDQFGWDCPNCGNGISWEHHSCPACGQSRSFHQVDKHGERISDVAPKPPNYRPASKRLNSPHCGSCKMYERGKCWGYGNIKVEEDSVCDSYSPSDNSQQNKAARVTDSDWQVDSPNSSPYIHARRKLTFFDENDDVNWHFGATKDELFIALNIPKPTADKIHAWAKEQDWPEGTELEEPEEYHITLIYAPSGHQKHRDQEWWATDNSDSIHINGIDEFESTERGELNAFVLRVDTSDNEIETRMDRLLDDAESHGVEIKRYPGGNKPHITVAYGPKLPDGIKVPDIVFSSDEAHCGTPRTSSFKLVDGPEKTERNTPDKHGPPASSDHRDSKDAAYTRGGYEPQEDLIDDFVHGLIMRQGSSPDNEKYDHAPREEITSSIGEEAISSRKQRQAKQQVNHLSDQPFHDIEANDSQMWRIAEAPSILNSSPVPIQGLEERQFSKDDCEYGDWQCSYEHESSDNSLGYLASNHEEESADKGEGPIADVNQSLIKVQEMPLEPGWRMIAVERQQETDIDKGRERSQEAQAPHARSNDLKSVHAQTLADGDWIVKSLSPKKAKDYSAIYHCPQQHENQADADPQPRISQNVDILRANCVTSYPYSNDKGHIDQSVKPHHGFIIAQDEVCGAIKTAKLQPSSQAIQSAQQMLKKVEGEYNTVGDVEVVDGWYIETWTFGCLREKDLPVEEQQLIDEAREYEEDGMSTVIWAQHGPTFVALTPTRELLEGVPAQTAQKMANGLAGPSWPPSSSVMYHVAPEEASADIFSNGIDYRRANEDDWRNGIKAPYGNYLFKDLEDARFAQEAGGHHHIYEVRVPGLNLAHDPDQSTGSAMYTPEPIGPERVQRIAQSYPSNSPDSHPERSILSLEGADLLSNPLPKPQSQAHTRGPLGICVGNKSEKEGVKASPMDELSHFLSRVSDSWDTRQWPDPLSESPTHAQPKGCTCQDEHKLDCPVHGLNAPDNVRTMEWSIPEGSPVGYPQDQPRNWTQAVSTVVEQQSNDGNAQQEDPEEKQLDPFDDISHDSPTGIEISPKHNAKTNSKTDKPRAKDDANHSTEDNEDKWSQVHGDTIAQSRPSFKALLSDSSIRQSIGKSESDNEHSWYLSDVHSLVPKSSGPIFEESEPWEPGSHGKGRLEGGGVNTWKTNEFGEPTHTSLYGMPNGTEFDIEPDGRVVPAYGPETVQKAVERDPRLKFEGDHGWNFGSHLRKSAGPISDGTRQSVPNPKVIFHDIPEDEWSLPSAWSYRMPTIYDHENDMVHIGPWGTHHTDVERAAGWPNEAAMGNYWPKKDSPPLYEPVYAEDESHHTRAAEMLGASAPEHEWNFNGSYRTGAQVVTVPGYEGFDFQGRVPLIAHGDTIYAGANGETHDALKARLGDQLQGVHPNDLAHGGMFVDSRASEYGIAPGSYEWFDSFSPTNSSHNQAVEDEIRRRGLEPRNLSNEWNFNGHKHSAVEVVKVEDPNNNPNWRVNSPRPIAYNPDGRTVYIGDEGGYHDDMFHNMGAVPENHEFFPEWPMGRIREPETTTNVVGESTKLPRRIEWYGRPPLNHEEVHQAVGAGPYDGKWKWDFNSQVVKTPLVANPVNVFEIGSPTYDGRTYHGNRRPFTYIQHMKNLFLGPPGGDHYQMMRGKGFANIDEEPRGGVYTDPEGKKVVEFYSGAPEPEHVQGIVNALGADRAQLNEWHVGDEVHDNPDYSWDFNSKVVGEYDAELEGKVKNPENFRGYPGDPYNDDIGGWGKGFSDENGTQHEWHIGENWGPEHAAMEGRKSGIYRPWQYWVIEPDGRRRMTFDPEDEVWDFDSHIAGVQFHDIPEENWLMPSQWSGRRPTFYDPESDTVHIGPMGTHHQDITDAAMGKQFAEGGSLGNYFDGADGRHYEPIFGDAGHHHRAAELLQANLLPEWGMTSRRKAVRDPQDPSGANNSWNVPHSLNWHPGNYGKGLVHEGVVHTWNTNDDPDGQPGHPEYAQKNLGFGSQEKFWDHPTWESAFTIDPEGRTMLFENRPDIGQTVEQADPRLKVNMLHDWDFTSRVSHMLNWNPGEHGKGLIHNGEVHTWGVGDYYDGRPTHPQYADNIGISDWIHAPSWDSAFGIDPQGHINVYEPPKPTTANELGQLIESADPRLKFNYNSNYDWDFGPTEPMRTEPDSEDEKRMHNVQIQNDEPDIPTVSA